jgi:hypothetical protein
MNRLLIEHAFPAHFRSRSPNSISLTYFWLDLSGRLPFSKDQADTFVREWFLSTVMSTIVGVIGTIAAILVTSTIIPQMFDPGSITLLLSKPISRSGLFITKVLGGCAFILLLVSYLIVGLWLIAGLRFGIWNQGVLWCIPIFLLMFLIYYSVSAFVGLVWKNAIVAVVVTVVFWLGCFMVGSAMHGIDALVLLPDRITKLTAADGALVTVTEAGRMHVWSDEDNDWRQTYEPGGGRGGGVPTIDGPVYHEPTKQLLVGQGFRNPFGIIGQRITLRLGKENTGWSLVDGPALPSGRATFVVDNDGSFLAIATDDIFRLQGDPAPASSELSIFGMTLPFGGASFRPALADSTLNFAEPIAAAADPKEPRLVVSSGKEVRLFTREENRKWAAAASRTLPGKEKEGAAVALAGPSVLVAREDGKIWLLSSADLKIQKELTLEHYTQPRFVAASADGSRFAVLFQSRRLWLIEGRTGAARLAPVSGQGDISAVTFSEGKLLVADHVNRVIAYDGQSLAKTETHWPQMSRVEMVYYYGILPVYTVFPKPGELDNTVQYVLTGKRTTDLGVFRGDLSQRREDLHPWRPVASGLAFVAVMLLVACIYIERQEF